jgi:hypothetical protein
MVEVMFLREPQRREKENREKGKVDGGGRRKRG